MLNGQYYRLVNSNQGVIAITRSMYTYASDM